MADIGVAVRVRFQKADQARNRITVADPAQSLGRKKCRTGVTVRQQAQQRRARIRIPDVTQPFCSLRQIGRASCRERVEISVVAGTLKKKKKEQEGTER